MDIVNDKCMVGASTHNTNIIITNFSSPGIQPEEDRAAQTI